HAVGGVEVGDGPDTVGEVQPSMDLGQCARRVWNRKSLSVLLSASGTTPKEHVRSFERQPLSTVDGEEPGDLGPTVYHYSLAVVIILICIWHDWNLYGRLHSGGSNRRRNRWWRDGRDGRD